MLFAGEIDGSEFPSEMLAGFPADLTAKPGFVSGSLHMPQLAEECEEHRPQKVPILRPAREQRAEPQLLALAFVNVNDREIPLPAGGHVESEPVGAFLLKKF